MPGHARVPTRVARARVSRRAFADRRLTGPTRVPVPIYFRGRPLAQLRAADLSALVEARTPESRTLEYKRDLPGTDDASKKEFLADVSAFANTAGGVLLFGVEVDREDKAVPKRVVGVGDDDLDPVVLRLTNILNDGASPSLASHVSLHVVPVPDAGAPVLALGVQRSLAAPHRVIAGRSNRFYRRSDGGKYEPDVAELRRMFLDAQHPFADAEAFRLERLRRTQAREIRPDAAVPHPCFVHVLPLGRLDRLLDLRPHASALNTAVPPLGVNNWDYGYNADGYWAFRRESAAGSGALRAYTQWFRFGGAELFTADSVSTPTSVVPNAAPTFQGPALVGELRRTLPKVLDALTTRLGVDPPFVVSLSVAGLRGTRMRVARGGEFVDGGEVLDRDELLLPPTLLESAGVDIGTALTAALDVLWQAFGHPGVPDAYVNGPLPNR